MEVNMTVLDWIIIIVIGIGGVLGFTKGFIKQLASIVGLIAGLLIARALFASVGEKLAEKKKKQQTFAQVIAFILIWLLVPVVFLMLASALTRVMDIVQLGLVNRMLGAGLGVLKYMLLVGVVIHFIEFVDSKDNLIKSTVKQASVLYHPIEDFSGIFYPTIKNVTKQLID